MICQSFLVLCSPDMNKDGNKTHLKSVFFWVFFFVILRNLRRLYTAENKVLNDSLLLIAHPDDESMFFSPFLFYNSPYILCLSKCEVYNKKTTRQKELETLCKSRNWNFECLDYVDAGDWSEYKIAIDVLTYCVNHNIKNIITFDKDGVSSHKNHISCHKAMKRLQNHLNLFLKNDLKSFQHDSNNKSISKGNQLLSFHYLKSVNLIEKYILSLKRPSYKIPVHSIFGLENMLHHKSQLIWFRYIYILLSNYMNFNEIV